MGATYGGLKYPEVDESYEAQQGLAETKAEIVRRKIEQERSEAFRKTVFEGTPYEFDEEWRNR